jgi:hypothetical protein
VTLAEGIRENDLAATWHADAALREALFGNAQKARQSTAAAKSISVQKEVRAAAALSLAIADDNAGAKVLADDLSRRFPEDTLVNRVYLPTILARIQVNERNPAKAIELLQASAPYELGSPNYIWLNPYAMFVRGEAYLQEHEGPEAQQQFQKILAHRGVVQNMPIGSLAHLGLARACALSGDAAQARAQYQQFLSFWKDADADIPILKQARLEYQKLQ